MPWTAEEIHRIMIDIAKSSLRIMRLIDK